jgi:hypothetical protein
MINALAEIGDENVIESLLNELYYPAIDVRYAILGAVGKIWRRGQSAGQVGQNRIVELIELLRPALRDPAESIQGDAVHALREGGLKSLLALLTQLLADAEYHVRRGAAIALGQIGSNEAIPALRQRLREADTSARTLVSDDRVEVVKALGDIGGGDAIEALYDALPETGAFLEEVVMSTVTPLMATITTVVFAESLVNLPDQRICWQNPNVSDTMMALPNLRCLIIDAESSNRQCLERFLTYAVNSRGQSVIKKCITVYIYGDVTHLSRNTYNALQNMFQTVNIASQQSVCKMLVSG